MKKEANYFRYEDALTDNEILLYAQIINQFKNGEIDFTNLKNEFLKYGVTIEVELHDFSKKMMTIEQADIFRKRISEQNYFYHDVHHFILNSNEFKNVIFYMDYKAIEILANHGIPEYQQTMISILTTQLRHSYDKDETLAVKRNKWRRQINELKSQLSKDESFNKQK